MLQPEPRGATLRRSGGRFSAPHASVGAWTRQRATILLAEEHDATRAFLADNLTADGYDLLEAETAADAERLMATMYPDLAIVDLGLPDLDGLELIRRVRNVDGAASRIDPDIPLLVLTGRAPNSTGCAGSSVAATTTSSSRSRTRS